ncbi:MAG: TonB-dependent receptor domain-containing protein, partial [Cyclobacteriaceae bacterium]
NYKTSVADWPTRLSVGLEHQQMLLIGRNFGNEGGVADTIRFDDEVRSRQTMAFAQAEVDLPANTFLTLGVSLNDLTYDFYRLTDALNDTSFTFIKNFDQVWAPRIGLLKQIAPDFAVQGSISRGFSPPSAKEIRTGEGTINRDLEAELGINYEVGIRGTLFNQLLNYDITAFNFQLDETIISFTDVSGVVRFKNTGATDQRGLEANVFAYLIDNPENVISRLRIQAAYTYHNFKFKNYVIVNEEEGTRSDFSDNKLTGVSPHILVNTLDINTLPGLYLNLTHNYSDKVPLNDDNTVFADAYHLIDFKAGLENQLFDTGFDLFFGVNNLFDIRYSLGNDINAFGGRFFQPAPGRNWFAGLKVRI